MREQVKRVVKAIPLLGPLAKKIRRLLWPDKSPEFPGTSAYWEARYQKGGTSGSGSYGHLARWKADVINTFVAEKGIQSVVEFGCGDGNQLALASYPNYIGLDVSTMAVKLCRARFANDLTKSFFLYEPSCFVDNHCLFQADLAMSLDVIFHLVEDDVYQSYMTHLFRAARRFVIIYSSDYEEAQQGHERRRKFSSWVAENCSSWRMMKKIPNKYPYNQSSPSSGSLADFYFYAR